MKRTPLWILAAILLLPIALLLGGCSQGADNAPTSPTDQEPPVSDPTPEDSQTDGDTPAEDDGYAEKQAAITDYLTVFGRTPVINKGLTMFWTNSGFSFAFRGTGVTAKIETSTTNATYHGYLNVYLDGATTPHTTVCVDRSGSYTLAENLPDGDHTIEVRKRNEAIYGMSATLTLKSLSITDGKFRKDPPKAPKYSMEVIGDSITSGFGNMVTDGGGAGANFSTHTQDGTMTYATITARAISANASVLSRSGICYVTGADRDTMYPYYLQTAALPGNSADTSNWDFGKEEMDLIVINLGTNDTGARIDGKPIPTATYKELATNFLKLVRVHNPNATIVWAYGMMTHSGGDPIKAAVKQLNELGDSEIYYCPLPQMNPRQEGVGVHGHPDYLSHLISALALSDFLYENTFFSPDYTATLQDAVLIAAQYLPPEHSALTDAAALIATGCDNDQARGTVQAIIDACIAAFTAD